MIYRRNIINVLDRTFTKMLVNVNIASWLNKLLYIYLENIVHFLMISRTHVYKPILYILYILHNYLHYLMFLEDKYYFLDKLPFNPA